MAGKSPETASPELIEVELRNPAVAAFLAWFLPGAGHFYQRRFAKGVIFSVCILSTYFFGLAIGGGRVVYASFTSGDRRWQYVCQLGVGAPALPALVQNVVTRQKGKPLWPGIMTAPWVSDDPNHEDELSQWNRELGSRFTIGELYTVVAGLLNLLAIFDAAVGPSLSHAETPTNRGPPGESGKKKEGADP